MLDRRDAQHYRVRRLHSQLLHLEQELGMGVKPSTMQMLYARAPGALDRVAALERNLDRVCDVLGWGGHALSTMRVKRSTFCMWVEHFKRVVFASAWAHLTRFPLGFDVRRRRGQRVPRLPHNTRETKQLLMLSWVCMGVPAV